MHRMLHLASSRERTARAGLSMWLLLLSILAHALVPTGSRVELVAGSAFSASTAEVSLGPTRTSLGERDARLRSAGDGALDGAGSADPLLAPTSRQPLHAPPVPIAKHFRPEERTEVPDQGAGAFDARAPPSF